MKNSLENTDRILNLARNGKRLRKFVTEKLPRIREELYDRNSKTDKHDDGFSKNESPCQSMTLNLCYKSFTGSFGSSSTYSDIADMDTGLMAAYLVKWLNAHKDEVWLEIADMMIADAKKQRDVAVDEIESMKASLIALLDVNSED